MQIDNILIVSPPEYSHNQTFFDIAMSFKKSILPEPSLTTNNMEVEDTQTLVFGAHLLPKFQGSITGDNYIIYQSEQLSAKESMFVDEEYLNILRRYPVWDYSLANIEYLKTKGIDAKHVPIGYHRCLSNIKTGKSVSLVGNQGIDFAEWSGTYPPVDANGKYLQDIDVCFYGSVNDRRLKIIEELKSQTIDGRPLIVASFMGYGGFRDKLIARSKIILNLHYYDSALFEIFRCAHLFANKKCVVSEIGNDRCLEESFYCTNGFADYDNIVDRCMHFLTNDTARNDCADIGYGVFSQLSQKTILEGLV